MSCAVFVAAVTLSAAGCDLDFDRFTATEDAGPRDAGSDDAATPADAGSFDRSRDASSRDQANVDASTDAAPRAEPKDAGSASRPDRDAAAPDADVDAGDGDEPLACADVRADGSGSAIASVDTTNETDELQGSCGGVGSPEVIVDWRAPETDYWVLDTIGSGYDTVLYANAAACTGDALACNNNLSSQSSASEVVARFVKNQHVALVVDGNAGAKGTAVLNATRVACPTVDLDLAALPSSFVDEDADRTESFRFAAPSAGFYAFHARTGANVTLDLSSGPRCGGTVIGANTGDGPYGAEVIRTLSEGQVVTLTAHAAADPLTNLELDIQRPNGLACPSEDLFDHLNVDETLSATAPHLLTASCAPPAAANRTTGFAAVGFRVHVDIRGTTAYVIDVTSGFQNVVYLLEDDCGGSEYSCTVADWDADSMRYVGGAQIGSSPDPQDFVLVIQNIDQNTGGPIDLTYQIQVRILQ
jgi:hypothetical protein